MPNSGAFPRYFSFDERDLLTCAGHAGLQQSSYQSELRLRLIAEFICSISRHAAISYKYRVVLKNMRLKLLIEVES